MVVRGRETNGKALPLVLWHKVKALGSHLAQTMHIIGGTNNAHGMEHILFLVT